MKTKIHPRYVDAVIKCACGNVVRTRSTKEVIELEICSACHPFYTGKQKIIDTMGRVEKFKRKYAKKSSAKRAETKKKRGKRRERKTKKPKTS